MSDPVEEFGKHLDSCEQCQNNPFELCVAGHELLMLSVGVVAESQPTKRAPDEKPAGVSFIQKLFAAFRR